ncbi:MAG: CYTH domain-containing protein [Crocinitomicaceae bacterium]|nr:CYTH domain-containing protein [Flavobacteriales bacterium]NQZ35501.1 CYTH domain-containing protein [Crocinitomicaceae bacterium]
MNEIEYKFLVDHKIWSELEKPAPELIVQGYISKSVESTVRVRIKGDKGFLTIKGKTEGIRRPEFEYEIPVQDAESMIDLFTDKHIRKHRYEVIVAGKTWEVDEFHGPLEGLILAELEVESEEEEFEKPTWVTDDVSMDSNYFNAFLIDKC